jgi:hypothetical protein
MVSVVQDLYYYPERNFVVPADRGGNYSNDLSEIWRGTRISGIYLSRNIRMYTTPPALNREYGKIPKKRYIIF